MTIDPDAPFRRYADAELRRADIEAAWAGHPMPSDTDIAGWLTSEVETYAAWANGEMTGYVIEQLADTHAECDHDDCEWVEVASCWGYYSIDEAMSEGDW